MDWNDSGGSLRRAIRASERFPAPANQRRRTPQRTRSRQAAQVHTANVREKGQIAHYANTSIRLASRHMAMSPPARLPQHDACRATDG
jgi:hypothetical protein